MTEVAIIGCGPAGLLAAHAVAEVGHKPVIYSMRRQSQIFGAQYLHRAIPGITPEQPELTIEVIKNGTSEGYRRNVYGDRDVSVSWDKYQDGEVQGWDMSRAYEALWRKYSAGMYNVAILSDNIKYLLAQYQLVFTTMPAPVACRTGGHTFDRCPIWVLHGPMDEHRLLRDTHLMYYNGFPPDASVGDIVGPDWYRYSQINGYQSWEYSKKPKGVWREGRTISEGFKPLATNCDCWKGYDNLWPLGRFGKWKKETLTHHAYEEAQYALLQML